MTVTGCPEEVGHGSKGIVVGRISESRTLFYRGHEINMAGFQEEVSININHLTYFFLALRFQTHGTRSSWYWSSCRKLFDSKLNF